MGWHYSNIIWLMLMVGLGEAKVAVGREEKVYYIIPVTIVSNTIICVYCIAKKLTFYSSSKLKFKNLVKLKLCRIERLLLV